MSSYVTNTFVKNSSFYGKLNILRPIGSLKTSPHLSNTAFVSNQGYLEIRDSKFSKMVSISDGGALLLVNSNLNLSGSIF